MKRFFLLAIVPFLMISCEKEEILKLTEIPPEISQYLRTHFPENKTMYAVKDSDGLEVTYDIALEDGFFLKFNRKKEVIDIEGLSKLPDSVIPVKVGEYVSSNFTGNYIIGWELEDRNQQIKLNNDLELDFNMNGDFLRIDK